MKLIKHTFVFAMAMLIAACSKSDTVEKVAPKDLNFTSTVSTNGSGEVTFNATGFDIAQFTFTFGEAGVAPVKSYVGTISHTYAKSGSYDVNVLATSRDGLTSDLTQTVTVNVTEVVIPTEGYTTPDHYDGMTLVWQDEFNGTELNAADWNYEVGPACCNNELEYYQKPNTSVHDGLLEIIAKKETVGGRDYTSSRLTTASKKDFQYGRIDIRALLPKGKGIWPALWMLGSSINTGTGWPGCGEIDIMEMIGGGAGFDNVVHGTSHWDNGGHQQDTGDLALTSGILADEYHVFSVVWNASSRPIAERLSSSVRTTSAARMKRSRWARYSPSIRPSRSGCSRNSSVCSTRAARRRSTNR